LFRLQILVLIYTASKILLLLLLTDSYSGVQAVNFTLLEVIFSTTSMHR